MPIFSPNTVTYPLKICNIIVPILLLYLWKSGSEYFLWQKKNWVEGTTFLSGSTSQEICDYLFALISKINLISLRGGITGPLSKLRWSQDGWETSLEYILSCYSNCPLHSCAYGVNRFNPRKASNSDYLKPNPRALIYPQQDLPSHFTDRFILSRY